MTGVQLAWRNLWYRPMPTVLSILLFALGIGLAAFLLIFNKQVQDKFDANLAGVDLVIGAKGSPLQLILCNMYHIDAPTGNIPLKSARAFLNPGHPLIQEAVPLSLGDSYRGFRIVGTTDGFLDFYGLGLSEGRGWQDDFEVLAGADVAEKLGLKLGDRFHSSHGLIDDGMNAHDDVRAFELVGILKESGTVADQLLLTTAPTVWQVHDHDHDEAEHDHDEAGHDHDEAGHDGESEHVHSDGEHVHSDGEHGHADDHIEDGHDRENSKHAHGHDEAGHDGDSEHDHSDDSHGHEHSDGASVPGSVSRKGEAGIEPGTKKLEEGGSVGDIRRLLEAEGEELDITSVLLRFKGRSFQALNMQRSINENTDMQAATPAIEINRLYSMMGIGASMLRTLALAIIFVSALSVFLLLLHSLRGRKYELALMRVMGGKPKQLFSLIVWEGLMVSLLGALLGIALAHGVMQSLAGVLEASYRYPFTGGIWLKEEWWLLGGALLIGVIAAVIPGMRARRTDISTTLAG